MILTKIGTKEELQQLKFNSELEKIRAQINELVEEIISKYPNEFVASENMAYLQTLFKEKMVGTMSDRLNYCQYILDQNFNYSVRLQEMDRASYDSKKLAEVEKIMAPFGILTMTDFIDSTNINLGKVLNFTKT